MKLKRNVFYFKCNILLHVNILQDTSHVQLVCEPNYEINGNMKGVESTKRVHNNNIIPEEKRTTYFNLT